MRLLGVALVCGLVVFAAKAQAAVHDCPHCGRPQHCKQVCRLKRGTKKETKAEYSCEHEDFCVPGPSRRCGVKVECDEHGNKHRRIIWQPTWAQVRTRAKLVKKEVSKEVPDYKWEVETICSRCGQPVKPAGSTGGSAAE